MSQKDNGHKDREELLHGVTQLEELAHVLVLRKLHQSDQLEQSKDSEKPVESWDTHKSENFGFAGLITFKILAEVNLFNNLKRN